MTTRASAPLILLSACLLSAAVSAGLGSTPARAQSADATSTPPTAPGDSIVQLDPFTVSTAADSGYQAAQSVSGSRFVTDIKNAPFNVGVITNQLLVDTNAITMTDALRYATGAYAGQNTYGDIQDIYQRGFVTNLFLRDGIRHTGPFDATGTERVEVVNGPTSVLFGITNPGGTINYISKQPLAQQSTTLQETFGSWATTRTELDTGGPLNSSGTLLYRLPVSYYQSDRWLSHSNIRKFAASPEISWQPFSGTKFLFSLEYVNSHEIPLNPLPATNGSFDTFLPRNFTNETNGNFMNVTDVEPSLVFTQALGRYFEVRDTTAFFHHQNKQFENARGAAANGFLPRQQTLATINDHNFQEDVDLIGKFITPYGTLTTVLSYENRNDYDNTYDLSGYGAGAVVPPSWNLLNPATWNYNENAIATVTPYAWTDSHLMVNSYSALAQYSGLNDHLFLLGGLRVDDTKTVFTNKFVQPWVPVPYLQNKTSYQIGALYRINPNLAVYVNSSSSFSPTTQSLVNSNGTPVNPIPIIGTGREAGIKIDLFNGRLTQTIAGYEIYEKNIVEQILLTSNATSNTYYYIQDGLQRSKGIEYSATASLNKNIDLIAGYTYLTANDIDDPASPINQGERLGQNYHNKANLFVKYSFLDGPLKGAFAGLGGMWLSKSPYGLGPSSQAETIPSNRDVSVLLGYNRRIGHYNWRFQVNVANVFNWDYIAIDYYRAPPTNVMVTTAVTF